MWVTLGTCRFLPVALLGYKGLQKVTGTVLLGRVEPAGRKAGTGTILLSCKFLPAAIQGYKYNPSGRVKIQVTKGYKVTGTFPLGRVEVY